MNILAPWQNFYVIIGAAAGALIGIQFVVIALIASSREQIDIDAVGAFGTPTVVHFGSALVLAAIMSVPWPDTAGVSGLLLLGGAGGIIYVAIVFRRARRQSDYKPVGEDWLWYVILPCGIYAMIVLAAPMLHAALKLAPFLIGAAALGLLLVGVHNAWDTVTHIVSAPRERGQETQRSQCP